MLTADLVISYLLFCLLTEWEVSHTAVAFSLCYIMVVYAEWIQREWDKVKGLHRHHLPVIFLQLILQQAIPGKPAQRRIEIKKGDTARRMRSIIISSMRARTSLTALCGR